LGMLGRAKTMMRGWVAAPPAAAMLYSVACVNGHRLRGNRTEGYQALRCPSCGEAVFILPRSPLPEPPVPASTHRTRVGGQSALEVAPVPTDDAPHALVDPPDWPTEPISSSSEIETSEDAADIDWVDEPAPTALEQSKPTEPSPAAKPTSPRPKPRPAPARPATPAPAVKPAPVVVAAPRTTWKEWAWTHRNPLLAVGLVLLVLGAISVRRWRQRLEELPRIAEIGRSEGFRKLDSGDFFAAKKILADAAAAVDAMGGRFEGADAIRQGALEAAIFTDLVPRSLEDLVEEASTYRDVSGWSAHFDSMYRGRSILFETTITAVPDPNKPGSGYGDAYRILVGQSSKPKAKGRVDYQGFELFELSKPKLDEIKLFGARLATLEFDLAENTWVFTLEPDSGAFITHIEALEALHWPTGEPVEERGP